MEKANILNKAGLSKNESIVYLTLLRIGEAKSGQIVREAKVSGGKIYETLYKLVDKGLVKFSVENGIKHFMANNPDTILDYITEKKRELENSEKEIVLILESLQTISSKNKEFDKVELIKGSKGIYSVVYQSLKNISNKKFKIMGVKSSKKETYNNFWRNWHRERIQLKKVALIIFSDRNTNYWNFFNELEHTQIKEIKHITPSAIMISSTEVFIFSYEREFTCIHIISEPVSISFSHFFDDIWKMTKQKR